MRYKERILVVARTRILRFLLVHHDGVGGGAAEGDAGQDAACSDVQLTLRCTEVQTAAHASLQMRSLQGRLAYHIQ